MKIQLIVVQGKPEGKIIPLNGPIFKIGRGENCHLRPNSEQVSREHTEFSISGDQVVVRDLGSRNGTIVNGKGLTAPCTLKDRDLIQVGPLTFAISIQGAPAPTATAPQKAPAPVKAKAKAASPDDVSHADIEAWLVSDSASPTPDRPSGVYGGDTQTISTYRGDKASKPATATPEPEVPPASEPDEVVYDTLSDDEETKEEAPPMAEEPADESNPFFRKKPEAAPKATSKDSSDAASDILRKMMERKRSSR